LFTELLKLRRYPDQDWSLILRLGNVQLRPAQELVILLSVVASRHGFDACGQVSLIGPRLSDRTSNLREGTLTQSILKT